jgi:hypothetical protein
MNRLFTLGIIGGLAIAGAVSATAASAASFNGFGEDIPLESAAKQIVPDGWRVDFGSGVDKSAKVSWSSASDWKDALSSAAAKRGYQVQYGNSSVIVTKGGRVASAPNASNRKSASTSSRPAYAGPRKEAVGGTRSRKQSTAEVRETRSDAVGGGGFVITPIKGEKSARGGSEWREYKAGKDGGEEAPASNSLRVNEGDSLRAVLNAWAEKNGWKLVWKSEFNYPIAASANFEGDFVQATTSLIKAFDAARPSITADFWTGNNVVVISNTSSDEAN